MFKSKKELNFTERINAFRVTERHERMGILGGKNTESVKHLAMKKNFITFLFQF